MTRFGITNSTGIGKLDLDSQNGTISNCILEIPQNLKIEISGTTVTLKAGSVCVLTGSTYSTITKTTDVSRDVSNWGSGEYFLVASTSSVSYLQLWDISVVGSGNVLPLDATDYTLFFKVDEKIFYEWKSNSASWEASTRPYPFAKIIKDSNGIRFAKDSNGNDMIFNGACFVGHHAVIYPNVKGLIANGFNTDGSMKSIEEKINSLNIIDLTTSWSSPDYADTKYITLVTYGQHVSTLPIGNDVETREDILSQPIQASTRFYIKSENIVGDYGSNAIVTKFVHYKLDSNNIVSDFTIRQPVRMATVEMLSTELAEKADKSTTYTKTEVDASLALKANDSNVVHLAGNETITGAKTVDGAYFKVTNNGQFKLLTYDIRAERGTPPSQWLGMFPYLLLDKNGLRLSGLYCSYDTNLRNQISLVAYKGTSSSVTDYDTARIFVGYDSNNNGYIRLDNQTYLNPTSTSSTDVADVGFVNTRLNTRLQLVSVMPVSPNSETIYFVTTGQIYYGSTLIVDNSLESITGYDATATQTLKNINGTLTWVTDV